MSNNTNANLMENSAQPITIQISFGTKLDLEPACESVRKLYLNLETVWQDKDGMVWGLFPELLNLLASEEEQRSIRRRLRKEFLIWKSGNVEYVPYNRQTIGILLAYSSYGEILEEYLLRK